MPNSNRSMSTFAAVIFTMSAGMAQAQQAQPEPASQPLPDDAISPAPTVSLSEEQKRLAEDFYRAEFVILERVTDAANIDERMASRLPDPPDLSMENVLAHTDDQGNVATTMELVPRKELHLDTAAKRLTNSGRFRVLLATGWYQAFPPDYDGTPLWVTLGDWLDEAAHADVQGTITINRQRYLHVNVELNHWQPEPYRLGILGIDLNKETPSRGPVKKEPLVPTILTAPAQFSAGESSNESAENIETDLQRKNSLELVKGLNWPRAELITWIKETRRMRSEEVHFIDSPTLGVLVFFKKIQPEDAAGLIIGLGLGFEGEED